MNDMSRPGPLPPAADHERHDALLVAQLSAGDPLAPEQRAQAEQLVGTCGACAALAADLRAVSVAVAQEPVPSRRRDFRLSPEQAQQLSGNPLTRFLRRLSLPTARALQPAAAGVLSIGLVFLVAGYAWPDDAAITVQAEPNFATYGETVPSAAPAEEPAAPRAVEQGLEEAFGSDEAEMMFADPEFLETLPEHQAGTSEAAAQKSVASEADSAQARELELDGDELAAQAPSLADDDQPALGAAAADRMVQEPVDDLALDVDALVPDVTTPGQTSVAAVEAGVLADDGGPEEFLITLGLLLALGGGGLLLMGWLIRRSNDPLLR
jgi:hypothetical protein